MAKKRHLKGIDEADMELIDSKMKAPALSDNYEYLDAYARKLKLLGYKLEIKCKNEKQKEFLKMLKNKKKELCFGIGAAGTGKSYISLAYALKELKENNYERIIMVVPTAPAGGADLGLGFLKGELEDKTRPYKDADRDTIAKILTNSGNNDGKAIASALIGGGYIDYQLLTLY